jgi:5-methyltetrahydrofolate--homocysteine methyltransferase
MTKKEFLELTESRVVILDGSTGRNLQKRGMPTGVSPEDWMLKNPQILIDLQREFLEAGSDIIFAPTFTANRIKLAEYGLADRIVEINKGLVGLSKKAVREYREKTGSDRKVYIAADITMTGEQVQPLGNLPFEELVEVYKEQLGYILPEGVDLIVVETMMSLQECRAALLAVKEICELPVMISLTFNENGRTLYGTDPKTAVIVLQSMGADAVGLNCSTGPDKMHELVCEMKEYANVPVMVKPNAGIPRLINGQTVFPMGPEEFAKEMRKITEEGANLVGGCCGATPEHMELLVKAVSDIKRHAPLLKGHVRALTTEQKTLEMPLDGRFMIVGERINPTGKKALQAELREGSLAIVSQMAAEQKELGADLLDINMGMNGIDEKEMMLQSMQEALQSAELPFFFFQGD